MISKEDQLAASKDLVAFINKYTILLEQQLENIRQTTSSTVGAVMSNIEALNKVAETNKSASTSGSTKFQIPLPEKFDGQMNDILMAMMGALSADDVIAQRLAHVVSGIQTFNVGLAYVLVDFENRFNSASVNKLKDDILKTTYKFYSTEEERDIYKGVFGKKAI